MKTYHSMINRQQVGAFRVVTECGKLPKIEERDYSWTEQANILFIDRYDGHDHDYEQDRDGHDDHDHDYNDGDNDDDGQTANFHPAYSHRVGICQ